MDLEPRGGTLLAEAAAGLPIGQPPLHEVRTCLAGPACVLSAEDGQVRGGVHGLYLHDRRLLSRLVITVNGREPVGLRAEQDAGGADAVVFTASVPGAGDPGPDPSVLIERRRQAGLAVETLVVRNLGRGAVALRLRLEAGCDLAELGEVKAGEPVPEVAAVALPAGLRWVLAERDAAVSLSAAPAPDAVDAAAGALTWSVELAPRAAVQIALTVGLVDTLPPGFAPPAYGGALPWSTPALDHPDARLGELVARSLADLRSLLLADPEQHRDPFLAAGSPWFLTLFGRDALWAARFLLPLGTELAGGTLRTLARRQGRRHDGRTEEAPGKIVHEVRRMAGASDAHLPPLYYGSVDATPLFVCLLHDAWRWGMPPGEVADLLPVAERCLAWMRDDGDPDGDGFLEYVRTGHAGLANQGWKDSGDSIQFADGRAAAPPIALCEVQGYAYEAAMSGADLLDAFDRPGADRWREWAGRLAHRFRARFWVDAPGGAYPALALDGDKRPVDGLGSNMGHLLSTGLLSAEETALVAARLSTPDLDSGWGLRTFAEGSAVFQPLSYHLGSVWPHDTAITAAGLARTGHSAAAGSLLRGLLAAGSAFDDRLPELFGGQRRRPGSRPVPYPAACRPQAWAAAAVLSAVQTLLGLHPDVPAGQLLVDPLTPAPYAGLEVGGLRVAGAPLRVRLTDGDPDVDSVLPVRLA